MAAADKEVVLLGLCDGAADPQKYTSSCLNNKIGGSPDVFPGWSRLQPGCSLCEAPLVHVVQVYCPLEASPYHRTLHLFACTRPACSGRPRAWGVFRSQALETEVKHPGPQLVKTTPVSPVPLATDWCDAADDWGMEQDAGRDLSTNKQPPQVSEKDPPETAVLQVTSDLDVSDGLQQLSLRSKLPEEPRVAVPVLRGFFISVVEEAELRGEEAGMEHAQRLLREYEEREGVSVGMALEGKEGTSGEEKYEKSQARHGDAAFSRFLKRVSLCPEQVLRYCRSGEPLFISDPPSNMAQMVPVCGSCGSRRTFELQLMPALVSLLRPGGPSSDTAPLEFGTVLVFTCGESCWTPDSCGSPREEFVFLQDDPDQQLFI